LKSEYFITKHQEYVYEQSELYFFTRFHFMLQNPARNLLAENLFTLTFLIKILSSKLNMFHSN